MRLNYYFLFLFGFVSITIDTTFAEEHFYQLKTSDWPEDPLLLSVCPNKPQETNFFDYDGIGVKCFNQSKYSDINLNSVKTLKDLYMHLNKIFSLEFRKKLWQKLDAYELLDFGPYAACAESKLCVDDILNHPALVREYKKSGVSDQARFVDNLHFEPLLQAVIDHLDNYDEFETAIYLHIDDLSQKELLKRELQKCQP